MAFYKRVQVLGLAAFAALATTIATGVAQVQTNTQPTPVDQDFVTKAVEAGNEEIAQAQAQLRSNPDAGIRLFAQTMIRDHTSANGEVIGVAQKLGLKYPESRVAVADLGEMGTPPPATGLPSAMSARAYMQHEVQDHQQAIGLFKGEAANGAQELRTIAARALPMLNAHLAMAQQYLQTGHVSPEVTPTPGGSVGPP